MLGDIATVLVDPVTPATIEVTGGTDAPFAA